MKISDFVKTALALVGLSKFASDDKTELTGVVPSDNSGALPSSKKTDAFNYPGVNLKGSMPTAEPSVAPFNPEDFGVTVVTENKKGVDVTAGKNTAIVGVNDFDNVVRIDTSKLAPGVKFTVFDTPSLVDACEKFGQESWKIMSQTKDHLPGKCLVFSKEGSNEVLSTVLLSQGRTKVLADGKEVETQEIPDRELPFWNDAPTSSPTTKAEGKAADIIGIIIGSVFGAAVVCTCAYAACVPGGAAEIAAAMRRAADNNHRHGHGGHHPGRVGIYRAEAQLVRDANRLANHTLGGGH